MTLASFQEDFWRALWIPPREGAPIDAWPPANQPGFAVYRNTVLSGCVDALVSLYPAVHRLAGEAWMRAVAMEFAQASPPSAGELQHYGDGFPDLVERVTADGDVPWLADVARLDRGWNHSHVAADGPVLDLPTLARQDADRLSTMRLRPHPATRWFTSADWPAFSLWQAARTDGADPNPPHWHGQSSLLTRPDGAVIACEISPAAVALLDCCAPDTALGEALDTVQARFTDADIGAELARLLQQGAFLCPPAFITESTS